MTVKQAGIADAMRAVLSAAKPAATYAGTAGAAGANQVAEILGRILGLSPKGPSLGGRVAAPFKNAKRVIQSGRGAGIGVGELAKANPELVGELAGTTGLVGGAGAGAAGLLANKSAAFAEGFIGECMRLRVSPSALVKAAQAVDPMAAEAARRRRNAVATKAKQEQALYSGSLQDRLNAAAGGVDPYEGKGVLTQAAHGLNNWWFNNVTNSAVGRALTNRGADDIEADILDRQAAYAQAAGVQNATREGRKQNLVKLMDPATYMSQAASGSYNPYPITAAMFGSTTPWQAPAANPVQLNSQPAPAPKPAAPVPAPASKPVAPAMPAKPAMPPAPVAPAKPTMPPVPKPMQPVKPLVPPMGTKRNAPPPVAGMPR